MENEPETVAVAVNCHAEQSRIRITDNSHDFPRTQLRRVRRRLLGIGAAAAIVWGLAAATLLLLLGVWLDLLWEFSPAVADRHALGGRRPPARCCSARWSALTVRAARDAAVARRLDRAGGAGGRILTGWELDAKAGPSEHASAQRVESRAERRPGEHGRRRRGRRPPGRFRLAKAVPLRPLGPLAGRARACSGPSWRCWRSACRAWPGRSGTASCGRSTTCRPSRCTEFEVTPGDVQACSTAANWRSAPRSIGAPVEQLELVLRIGQRPGAAAADVSRARRRLAGGAGQGGRAGRLLRPRLSRPQREVSHRRHHRAADRKRRGCGSSRPPTPIAPPTKGRCPRTASAGCPARRSQVFAPQQSAAAAAERSPLVERSATKRADAAPQADRVADEAHRARQPGGRRASSRSPATASSSAA